MEPPPLEKDVSNTPEPVDDNVEQQLLNSILNSLQSPVLQANFKITMTVPAFDNQGNLAGIEDTMIAVFNKLANSAIVFSVTQISAPTVLNAESGSLLMADLTITVLTTWS